MAKYHKKYLHLPIIASYGHNNCSGFKTSNNKMATIASIFTREAGNIMRNHTEDGPDRDFRYLFGISLSTCVRAWNLCVDSNYLPAGTQQYHFLWSLMFLKLYGTQSMLARLAGTTQKTYRKWVWPIIRCLSRCRHGLVSYYIV